MPDMIRIGMLTPSSNTVLEPLTYRIVSAAPEAIGVHFARFHVTTISSEPASTTQFALEPMVEAARLLSEARVDVIVWNGTSGGWNGVEQDRQLVAAIEGELRIPATTGTLASLEALHALGAHRYGLVVPYVEDIVAAIQGTFAREGFECVGASHEGIVTNWDFSTVAPETLAQRCRTLAASGPDAILIFCTNLAGAPVADQLERELGVPIVDSVATCLWGGMRRMGDQTRIPGWGRLLSG
jgi:maleate isomerase